MSSAPGCPSLSVDQSTVMTTKRTTVVLSDQLVKDIDALAGTRQRSSFLTQAAEERETGRRLPSPGR
jgi:hypothetical protein